MARPHYHALHGLEADGRRLARAALTAKDAPIAFMPIDHFLLRTAAALPAIVVTQLPGGAISFIVVCQSFSLGPRARWLQVMDPASGRRWLRAEQLQSLVYTPRMRIAVSDWQRWAASEDFSAPLQTRLGALGIRPARAVALYQAARQRNWRALAGLDAATRMTGHQLRGGGVRRGRDAAGYLDGLLDALYASEQLRILSELRGRRLPRATEQLTRIVPRPYWSAFPLEHDANTLEMRGCVLVHATPMR